MTTTSFLYLKETITWTVIYSEASFINKFTEDKNTLKNKKKHINKNKTKQKNKNKNRTKLNKEKKNRKLNPALRMDVMSLPWQECNARTIVRGKIRTQKGTCKGALWYLVHSRSGIKF